MKFIWKIKFMWSSLLFRERIKKLLKSIFEWNIASFLCLKRKEVITMNLLLIHQHLITQVTFFLLFLVWKKKGFSLSLLFKHGEKRGEESLLNLIFLQYTMAGRNMLKRSTFFLCFFLWQLKISSMQTIYWHALFA